MSDRAPVPRHSAWPVRRLQELRLAMMLLTRFPAGTLTVPPPLSSALWAFPIAGLLHGLAIGSAYAGGLVAGLRPTVAALLAVAVGVLASGALHEDGLADCADGFGGGASRDRKLEIMRDSRIGTFGAIALLVAIGLRVALIAEFDAPLEAMETLAGLGAITRGLLPLATRLFSPARGDGLAAQAAAGQSLAATGFALLIALSAGALLVACAHSVIAATALAMASVWWLARYQIGGVTGDVLGASQVVGEIAGLAARSICLAQT